jgi:hypothetical protein
MELDEPDVTDVTDVTDRTSESDLRRPTTTGVPHVDEVIADVDRLDEAPLEEHLEVFERAHESLRAALDAQPDDRPSDDPVNPA